MRNIFRKLDRHATACLCNKLLTGKYDIVCIDFNISLFAFFAQEARESVEQFFAEYGETGKKVFEEEDDEEEEEEEPEEKEGAEGEEEREEQHVQSMLLPTELSGSKLKKKLLADLHEILDVTHQERSQVADIVRVLKDGEEGNEQNDLNVMFLVQRSVADDKSPSGEWLYTKISEIKKYVSGTAFQSVVPMLRGIFHKTAAYYTASDLSELMPESVEKGGKGVTDVVQSEEGKQEEDQQIVDIVAEEEKYKRKMRNLELQNLKKSKSGFPELGLYVKSHKQPDGSRAYACPLLNCTKSFISPRTCDAHINRHLGYEYGPCVTCGYTNESRDSFDKHKCFAGAKTGGQRPPSRGAEAQKRVAAKRVAAAAAGLAAEKKEKN